MFRARSRSFSPLKRFTRGMALFVALAIVASIAVPPAVFAQATTGNIAGTVTARNDQSALPGVTVEAVHQPTGTRYSTVSDGEGRFFIPNVRVGGPYVITATLEGFNAGTVNNVQVPLGGTAPANFGLQLAGVTEAITVTARPDDVINPNRTGSTSAVSNEQIESLPTVNRTLQDFARTNPYFSVDPQDESGTRMNVAGKNNRYNTIQIDGAVNNDLFGLSDTGTPGGQTDAPPISLDAVEQIQLVVSPYDVRQGGFTGGGVNVVTRSGTNEINGSAFYSMRDQSLVGDGPTGQPISDFSADQYGGRVGGPILRDQLFFFLNGERNEREEPSDVSADPADANINAGLAEKVRRVQQIAMEKYGYDPGGLGSFPQTRGSDNFFGRLDWNIGTGNQLTLRHNYVDASRDVVSDRFFTRFRFPNSIYMITDETNSTVGQLNSAMSANAFNEARVNYTTIRDARTTPGAVFPSIDIGGRPRSAEVIIGTERFSGANSLDQDILAITNDFTWITGAHTLTFGTHNEFFSFKNLFMSDAYGYYFFPSVEAFEAGTPSEYSITFATGDDPRRPTAFDVAQYGLYASDSWRVRDDLTLVLGLRADMPQFGDTPSFNERVTAALPEFSTGETASEEAAFSPRFGFNWQLGGAQQLRGGIGVFAGRTPYVWISNAYGNTGVEQVALSCRGNCKPEFVTDPFNQPTDFPAGSGAFSVDLIDPDFQLPRVLRTTLGYDRELFWGIRGTAELLWSRNLEDAYYQNVNLVETGTSELDGRPTYGKRSTALRDAILLTNTDEGDQLMQTIQLNRNFGNFTLAASYAHEDAESAFDGTSSRAISNWQFHHTRGDVFTPEASRSAFETEHRYNIAGSWNFNTGFLGHTIGLFYNAQSGRPYSLLFGSDINKDGYSTNDLLYIPADGDVIIQGNSGSQWVKDGVSGEEQWAAFLAGAGLEAGADRILSRYESNEPWVRKLDFHYELGLPVFNDFRTDVTFDVLNLLNMFDDEAGNVRYVSNQNYSPVTYQGIDQATGKPIYRERFAGALESGSQFTTSRLGSRWQAKLGVRVSF